MRAIRIEQPSKDPEQLDFRLMDVPKPVPGPDQCLIEVHGSGVNMSDVKGIMGVMHKLVWPRTPGRDYAGIVAEGPDDLIDKQVWGSGGDLGMGRDGAHAEYILVETASIAEKPANISMREAAAVGVPFCTAHVGLVEYADIQPGECVIVFGANGSVGKAVIQVALMHQARVLAVSRQQDEYLTNLKREIELIDGNRDDLADALVGAAGPGGADIAFNTVGAPYFAAAMTALGEKGRQVIINAVEPKEVPLNLFDFYRKQLRLFGMASMSHDSLDLSRVLTALRPQFEAGKLKPFEIRDDYVFSLDTIDQAYRLVLKGETRNRVVVRPQA
jgi:NADPH2:quinone reductase